MSNTSQYHAFLRDSIKSQSIPAIHLLRLIFLESEKIGHAESQINITVDAYEQETSTVDNQGVPGDYEPTMVGVLLLLVDNLTFMPVKEPVSQTEITLLLTYLATPFDFSIRIHPTILAMLKTIPSVDQFFYDCLDGEVTDAVVETLASANHYERNLIMAAVEMTRLVVRNGQDYNAPAAFDGNECAMIFGWEDPMSAYELAKKMLNNLKNAKMEIRANGKTVKSGWVQDFSCKDGLVTIVLSRAILLPLLTANRQQIKRIYS